MKRQFVKKSDTIWIKPGALKGKVQAPSSKSMMQRAAACALLAQGTSRLYNPSFCDDCRAVLDVIEEMGARVKRNKDEIEITPPVVLKGGKLSCGESGLCSRIFIPIAATLAEEVVVDGRGSLLKRPFSSIISSLSQLGVRVRHNGGFLPVTTKGPYQSFDIHVNGSESSQFITGVLIAFSASGRDASVRVDHLKSRPYIDMTLDVIRKFGMEIERNGYDFFHIKKKNGLRGTDFLIESDWSGAAFWLVAGAVAGDVEVQFSSLDTPQGDKEILSALKAAGVAIELGNQSVRVRKSPLKAFDFNAEDCPDLFPPLAVLAACSEGVSKVAGVNRLKNKESDRASALKNEFANVGIEIELSGNDMYIKGGEIKGGVFNGHQDHRMVMAGTLAGVVSSDEIKVTRCRAVDKSYPGFFADFNFLGGRYHE